MKKDNQQVMGEMKMVKLGNINPSPTNPRKTFDEDAIVELSTSIAEKGVIQPVLLRPLGKDTYELVCGERRYRASLKVKDTPSVNGQIPAYIRDMSDDEALELQITENLQRKDVHPMEEAVGFKALLDAGKTAEEISFRVGKSVHFVNQRLKLNMLTEPWQKLFYYDKVSLTDALKVALLKTEHQEELLEQEGEPDRDPKIANFIKITAYDLKSYHGDLTSAPFALDDMTLDKKAGACVGCPFNSATANLFPDDADKAVCTNLDCYKNKCDVSYKVKLELAKDEPDMLLVADFGSSQKNIDKLRAEGCEIITHSGYREIIQPDKPNFDDFKEEEQEWHDTEESLLKSWNGRVADYEQELSEYNEKIASGTYHKAFVVDGADKGKYVYVSLHAKRQDSKNSGKSSAKEEPTTVNDIKTEIERIESKEKRAKELDEEKVHERVKEALKATEFWQHGEPLSHQEYMGAVIYLYNKMPWNQDELKAKICGKKYKWGDDETLFDNLIKMPTEDVQIMFYKLMRYVMFDDLKGSMLPDSDKGAALQNIARQYISAEVSTFKLEQAEKSAKREEKVNARLKELNDKLAAKQKPKTEPKGKGVKALLTDAPGKGTPKKTAKKK